MIDLNEKRIVITGASSGIGRAVAIHAASLGASLILFGRNKERLKATYDNLRGTGHEYYSLDITNYNDVAIILNNSVLNRGYIDGFVHCAGIEKILPFKASKPDIFKEVFEINVFAGFEIARLITQKKNINPLGASLVFISSVNALMGDACKTIYCSSKSALLAGVKSIAIELAPKKIRCNCILPGCVETEMINELFLTIPDEAKHDIINKHPLGIGKPEDVAFLVSFLISDSTKWITGSEFVIDGGYSA